MDGDIRLMGGANSLEGRVEICQRNNFDTVCDDFWDEQEAKVVCRQLGYAGTGSYQPKKLISSFVLFVAVERVRKYSNAGYPLLFCLLQCDYDTLIL